MNADHFSDEIIKNVQMNGYPLTNEERDFLINDIPQFEICNWKKSELNDLSDSALMGVAFAVWNANNSKQNQISTTELISKISQKLNLHADKEIAAFLGISKQNYSDFKNGRRGLSKAAKIKALDALYPENGITRDMLLDLFGIGEKIRKSELDIATKNTGFFKYGEKRDAGRPVEIDGKRVQIYLDEKSLAIAKMLGNDNVSLGIRIALNGSI